MNDRAPSQLSRYYRSRMSRFEPYVRCACARLQQSRGSLWLIIRWDLDLAQTLQHANSVEHSTVGVLESLESVPCHSSNMGTSVLN